MDDEKKVHIDLFSGIGGGAIATETVWPNIEHIFVENNDFAQQVLKKHWPEAPIFGDIRTFTYAKVFGGERRVVKYRRGSKFGEDNIIDLLTGGFPCQPFSQAGRRKGTSDDRFLWPEMFRVIREFQPTWIVGENVAGLLTIEQGMVLKQVCADLESEGYEVQCFVIPAVAVNAPHRRDRVWIVAHAIGNNNRAKKQGKFFEKTSQQNKNRASISTTGKSGGADKVRKDERLKKNRLLERDNASDSKLPGLERGKRKAWTGQRRQSGGVRNSKIGKSWNEDWIKVATELCRVDDGLPARLVRLPDGRKISHSKWRQEALKGLGNAWVPEVAIKIFEAIKQIELSTVDL